jgi:ubiquinone/menaquinone biosynthesis C-methylase UbiE
MPPASEDSDASARTRLKEEHELGYWRSFLGPILADPIKTATMGAWYEYFYTEFFGLTKRDYAGLRLLDIGCGPMGTLEWADVAAERVGLDPLAPQYLDLVKHRQAMRYCAAPAEKIPFPDGHFDSVTTFNSLDHVEDVGRTISEIKRVTKPSGRILLIVEIDHPPTETEPHQLDQSIITRFGPEFVPSNLRLFGIRDQYDLYGALKQNVPHQPGRPGLLTCRFDRRHMP